MACHLKGIRTPTEFSRRLNVSKQTAQKWWHGLTRADTIRGVDVHNISTVLNVSMFWLMFGGDFSSKRRQLNDAEHYALELCAAFPDEHSKWRDDWLSDGVRRLELLGLRPPKKPHPPPATPGGHSRANWAKNKD